MQAWLGDQILDFDPMQATISIYRAAAAVHGWEVREVLADVGLWWGGFTTLWVLWMGVDGGCSIGLRV